ncbi:MAG: MATE family efflux transporter [Bacteroidia bacterium]
MKNFISTYKSYFKKIAILAYPIVIGQIGIVAMGVADVVMIGQIDATNLAAAGLANSVFFLVAILGIGSLMAVSSLVAQSKGAEKNNDCAIYFRQGIVAALLLSVVISFVLYFVANNMEVFKQHPTVTVLSSGFLHLLNMGTLPLLIFSASKQFSDGLSFTRPSAIITVAALLLNIFLNWLLIYGNLGFPKMGLNGAGVATLIARIFMATAMVFYILVHKRYKKFIRISRKESSYDFLKHIFRVGLPSGFQYFFELAAFSFAGIMIGWIGKNEQAAHHIALNVASVTYMIATGISAAGSILVGDALGRKNKTDIIRSGKASLLGGAVFMLFCAAILFSFRAALIHFYIHDSGVEVMAGYLLIVAALFQLSDGIQCVALGVLRGLEDTKIPTIVTVISYWVIGIPAGYYLAFYTRMNLYGVWAGLLAGLTFSAFMLAFRFLKESKQIEFSIK